MINEDSLNINQFQLIKSLSSQLIPQYLSLAGLHSSGSFEQSCVAISVLM